MPYELPGGGRKTEPCIVCGSPANILARDIHSGAIIDCSRCGDFSISRMAATDFLPLKDLKQRALASHLIRRLQGENRPALHSDFFQSLSDRTLPTPAEASDSLLLWLADQADGRPGKPITITYSDPEIQALIGVIDWTDLEWVIGALKNQGLLEGDPTMTAQICRLTPMGWLRVEELKQAHVSSRFAFFARKFQNLDLDRVFEECLRQAVAQTGYELLVGAAEMGHFRTHALQHANEKTAMQRPLRNSITCFDQGRRFIKVGHSCPRRHAQNAPARSGRGVWRYLLPRFGRPMLRALPDQPTPHRK